MSVLAWVANGLPKWELQVATSCERKRKGRRKKKGRRATGKKAREGKFSGQP